MPCGDTLWCTPGKSKQMRLVHLGGRVDFRWEQSDLPRRRLLLLTIRHPSLQKRPSHEADPSPYEADPAAIACLTVQHNPKMP